MENTKDMSNKDLLEYWHKYIYTILSDGMDFHWEGVGVFSPKYVEEYIAIYKNDKYLMPPRIIIKFSPDSTLLTDDFFGFDIQQYLKSKHLTNSPILISIAEMSGLPPYHFSQAIITHTLKFLENLQKRKVTEESLLGTFQIFSDESENYLSFRIGQKLYSQLQTPFDAFEPTKLKQSVSFDSLYKEDVNSLEPNISVQRYEVKNVIKEDKLITPDNLENRIQEEDLPSEDKLVYDQIDMNQSENDYTNLSDKNQSRDTNKKRSGILLRILIPVLILFIFGAYFIFFRTDSNTNSNNELNKESISKSTIDSLNNEGKDTTTIITTENKIVDSVVVKRGENLSALARKYYTDVMFWVYIYIENKEIITDYNNLPLGKTLYIPSLTKYKVDPNSEEAKAECRRLEFLIYSNKL